MERRNFCLSALGAGLFLHSAAHAAAGYPSRPVRIIVPYAAGGGPDVMMRQFGPTLGDEMGQPIVVENKVGAGGVLAAQYVAQSPPDGYTVLMGSRARLSGGQEAVRGCRQPGDPE